MSNSFPGKRTDALWSCPLHTSRRTAFIIPFPFIIFHLKKHFTGERTRNLLASFLLLLRDIKVTGKNVIATASMFM